MSDCEMLQAYGVKMRKARKSHECLECGCDINPGSKYNYHHGIHDGSGVDYKVCLECDYLRNLLETDPWDIIGFGEISEVVEQYCPPHLPEIVEFLEREKIARAWA